MFCPTLAHALAFKLASACAFAFPLDLTSSLPCIQALDQPGQHRNSFKQDLFLLSQIPATAFKRHFCSNCRGDTAVFFDPAIAYYQRSRLGKRGIKIVLG